MAKAKRKSTMISINGDRAYVQAVKALAMQKDMTIAALVRDALDRVYGKQIKSAGAIFLQSVELSSYNSALKKKDK